jgi:hypothetical protein
MPALLLGARFRCSARLSAFSVIAHPGVTTPPWALDHLAGK